MFDINFYPCWKFKIVPKNPLWKSTSQEYQVSLNSEITCHVMQIFPTTTTKIWSLSRNANFLKYDSQLVGVMNYHHNGDDHHQDGVLHARQILAGNVGPLLMGLSSLWWRHLHPPPTIPFKRFPLVMTIFVILINHKKWHHPHCHSMAAYISTPTIPF